MVKLKFLALALIATALLASEVFTATLSPPSKAHDEIVLRAKKEGKLQVLASMESANQ